MEVAPDVELRLPVPEEADAFLDLVLRNREHFRPYEPRRPGSYFTLGGQRDQIAAAQRQAEAGERYEFGIWERANTRLVGRISLGGISRGALQNAYLGYGIDIEAGGRGYATQAVKLAVRVAFDDLGLHRVQAAVVPENTASARVLLKVGFLEEGLARRYLFLDGQWKDHRMFALTVDDAPEDLRP
jgi:[ribosomal protein S5]-alanine N-acetyltransferase